MESHDTRNTNVHPKTNLPRRLFGVLPLFGLLLFSSALAQMTVERVASGLTRPVGLVAAPGDDERLFVVEQTGRILVVRNDTVQPTPFLDLTAAVSDLFRPGSVERGLLGLAFHPEYQLNGHFFVYYMAHGDTTTVLQRYSRSTPDVADAASAATLLTLPQPTTFHNAGQLAFGPDGYLYLGLGDGGVCANAQDKASLLGKVLRLDVDGAVPYAVPADNPFVGVPGAREEIWVYGLRNPWRFSFDSLTGDLYLPDVGPSVFEEVNFQPASSPGGESFGWSDMEGNFCNSVVECPEGVTIPDDCTQGGFHKRPIFTYSQNSVPQRCAIVGGFVYRGAAIPTLHGNFFYADFCTAQIYSLKYDGSQITFLHEWTDKFQPTDGGAINRPSSFGVDNQGELYVVDWGNTGIGNGEVYRMLPSFPTDAPARAPREDRLLPSRPNPFNPSVSLRYELARAGSATLEVLDARGRIVRTWPREDLAAGEHRIQWDGRDDHGRPVGSGVYLLRLRTVAGEDRGKVVLVR